MSFDLAKWKQQVAENLTGWKVKAVMTKSMVAIATTMCMAAAGTTSFGARTS